MEIEAARAPVEHPLLPPVIEDKLRIAQKAPGHLLTLESRSIIGPAEQNSWPDVGTLVGRGKNIFRKEREPQWISMLKLTRSIGWNE
jgi:hypothetical protein